MFLCEIEISVLQQLIAIFLRVQHAPGLACAPMCSNSIRSRKKGGKNYYRISYSVDCTDLSFYLNY